MHLIETLERALGKAAIKNFLPLQPGDVPATYADVDDLTHDIDVIIRGEDLLSSTGRQFRLAQLLGRTALPLTLHHALLCHPDGRKLSKSNRDTALRERRRNGATPQALLGEVAQLVGLQPTPRSLNVADLAALFLDRC